MVTVQCKLSLMTCALKANAMSERLSYPSTEQLTTERLSPYALPCLVKECRLNQKNLSRHLEVKHGFTPEEAEAIQSIAREVRSLILSPRSNSETQETSQKDDHFRVILESFEELTRLILPEHRGLLTNILSLLGGLSTIMHNNRLDQVIYSSHIYCNP